MIETIRVPASSLRAQTEAILRGWGMTEAIVAASVEGLAYADLHGIDSHGAAMLPTYERWRGEGRFNPGAAPRVVREGPVTALIEADGALGFLPATMAMRMAIAKARAAGLAAVAVRGSNHCGAAGFYATMAVREGLLGFATTNTYAPSVVPTRGRQARFGTNPIAFAAPASRHPPFVLDMATSTVALGKLMAAAYRGEAVPEGWALGPDGRPTTDPALAHATRLATPLGGTAKLSSHKGYGLAAMVEILSATLSGASAVTSARGPGADARGDVGHFLLALDPAAFRPLADFEADLDAMIASMHATAPVDPSEPVLVAGDPERAQREARLREGVPLPATLVEALRGVAGRAGAAWHLGA